MKKYIIGGLVGFILATAASVNAEGVNRLIDQVVQGVFPVTVEGNSIGEAVVIDNKTYLPVREFGEAVGYKVTFTEDREVVLTKNAEPTGTKPDEVVTEVNPRIAEINKELEEWNSNYIIVTKEIKDYEDMISELKDKVLNAEEGRTKEELKGTISTLSGRLEGSKQKKQQVESEIAKLEAELKTLQP